MQNDKVYKLPSGITIALSTGRPEMVDMVIADVTAGRTLFTKEESLELLRLVRDLIIDREEVKQRDAERVNAIKSSMQNLEGVIGTLDKMTGQ